MEYAKKLLAIGAFCIGTNQIDLSACSAAGIAVFNAPYSNTRSVVELIIGEIIMLYRKTFDKSTKLHQGIWDKSAKHCHEIRGQTLGIVGYGNIGSQLSVVAENLGMEVMFYDIVDKLAYGNAKRSSTLEELLKKSDVVTIHVDGRKSNTDLIDEREFAAMKDGVMFLNASRGFIVNIQALVDAIKSGKIAGAAIDVFPKEPKSSHDPFESELQNLPNVILTPHIGAGTEEAQKNIADFVCSRLISFIDNGDTTMSVNIPNLQLPKCRNITALFISTATYPAFLRK
jgi:D-3-phosphoglycerate dehydrogenase